MLLNCGVGDDSRNPLNCKEIKPVNPKEIRPEYLLEGLMPKLKLQNFGHLRWRSDSLEKTFQSPLECKEIQSVHPKGNPSWIFIGRTDAEAETPILWPPDGKNWLIWKDPDAGKDWRWEKKGRTEDEMGGRHHWRDWHEFV